MIFPIPREGKSTKIDFLAHPAGCAISRGQWPLMERPSSGTVFPVVRCLNCGSLNGGNPRTAGEGKTNPAGWFSMSALGAQGNCATCGSRFETRVFLIPGADTGNQEGISRSAERDQVPPGRASTLILSAHGAGIRIVAYGLRGWIAPGHGPGPVCRLRAGFRLPLVGACGAFWGIWLHFVSSCRFCPFFLRLFPPL